MFLQLLNYLPFSSAITIRWQPSLKVTYKSRVINLSFFLCYSSIDRETRQSSFLSQKMTTNIVFAVPHTFHDPLLHWLFPILSQFPTAFVISHWLYNSLWLSVLSIDFAISNYLSFSLNPNLLITWLVLRAQDEKSVLAYVNNTLHIRFRHETPGGM